MLLAVPRMSVSGPMVDGREVALLAELPVPSAAGGVSGIPVVVVAGKDSPVGNHDETLLGNSAG